MVGNVTKQKRDLGLTDGWKNAVLCAVEFKRIRYLYLTKMEEMTFFTYLSVYIYIQCPSIHVIFRTVPCRLLCGFKNLTKFPFEKGKEGTHKWCGNISAVGWTVKELFDRTASMGWWNLSVPGVEWCFRDCDVKVKKNNSYEYGRMVQIVIWSFGGRRQAAVRSKC